MMQSIPLLAYHLSRKNRVEGRQDGLHGVPIGHGAKTSSNLGKYKVEI
jgi:hypothetical protein